MVFVRANILKQGGVVSSPCRKASNEELLAHTGACTLNVMSRRPICRRAFLLRRTPQGLGCLLALGEESALPRV